jgi:hypothetical protein
MKVYGSFLPLTSQGIEEARTLALLDLLTPHIARSSGAV